MTSKGAEMISTAISDKDATKLISLNLSGNFIGDKGAKHLADVCTTDLNSHNSFDVFFISFM